MHRDGRVVLTGPSAAVARADTENRQFYHDRCIAATTYNFLLRESKYGFAGPKSLCYIRQEVGIFDGHEKHRQHCCVAESHHSRQAENERASLNN
jgi:hypothetical protein